MAGLGSKLFGLILKAADHVTVCLADGRQSDGKPRIYIADDASPREKAAIVGALKCPVILSREEYSDNAVMRTIDPRHVIPADGGFNTEWLHSALKSLKAGGGVLIFSAGNMRYVDAVVLALLSGAEILPLYSKQCYKLGRRRCITVGEPISPGGIYDLSADRVNSEIARVDTAMSSVREV